MVPRHSLLAVMAGALLVLAGCAGVPTGDGTQPTQSTTAPTTAPGTVTTTETTSGTTSSTTQRTTTDTTHDRWIRGSAYTVNNWTVASESSTPIGDLDASEARVVNGTIANGSTTVTTYRDVFDGGHYPIRVGDAFYRVNRTELEREQIRVHRFQLRGPVPEDSDAYDEAASEAVAVESLSEPDRRVFERGMPSDAELEGISLFSRSIMIHYENGTPPDALTFDEDGPRFVEDDGEYYRVEYDGTGTTDRVTSRYTATRAANSTDAYEDYALDRYVTNASNTSLPEDAHQVLIDTLETGSIDYHSETPTIAEPYETFYHWTRDHRFVRYEADIYRLDIMPVME